MKKRAFHFEVKNLLTQFIAAFDDVVISRWNKDRSAKSNIEVRYVFAPKQRVMYDIINKAQNITLPVVAVNLASVSRDESRVFNKLQHSGVPSTTDENPPAYSKFLMPVPINLEVNMSILARYMQDIDQIISNFVPYNNPYIILSWEVPSDFGANYTQEIRSEVLWNGELTYDTPTDTTYNDQFRVTVDTSFTIKGWLFPEEKDTSGPIYKIDNNFINVNLANKIYSPYDPQNEELQVEYLTYEQQGYAALSSYNSSITGNLSYTETVTVSGIPEFTNIFYSTTGTFAPLRGLINVKKHNNNSFILYGKRFGFSNSFYISSNNPDLFPESTTYEPITSAKSDTISGYKLSNSLYNIDGDNFVSIYLPASTLSANGKFVFITNNNAGTASSFQASSSIIALT